jgi:steroid delta-isomerase-like uncharacterized protein
MTSLPDQLIRRWFEEVWNQGRVASISELLAPDAIAHGLGEAGREARGPAEFRPFFDVLKTAFPDFHVVVEDTVAEGDRVACRWTARGTHAGAFGELGPSGRSFTVSGMSFVRVRDGMIAEGWNCWDLHGLLQQVAPPAAAPPLTLVPARA